MPNTIHSQIYKDITAKLKAARLESGLTQKQVAQKLKRPQSYISKVEIGEQRIDVVELKEFAILYKKKISYFV